MCHDFGTPVAVLQMLLLMLRKRMLRDQERERREAAEKAEKAEKAKAESALGEAAPLHAPQVEAGTKRGVAGRLAPISSVASASSVTGSNMRSAASSSANFAASSNAKFGPTSNAKFGATSNANFGGKSNGNFGATSNANFGGNSNARSIESYEDTARLLDVIRRASAGLELLEVTRQKAIAFSKLQAGGSLMPDCKPFEVAELMRKSASIAQDT
eukprot:4733836-Pleurochrysis_carterae.AAC.1